MSRWRAGLQLLDPRRHGRRFARASVPQAPPGRVSRPRRVPVRLPYGKQPSGASSWQQPWQHPDRPMCPHRPRNWTIRTIWHASDGYDSRVTRLRAWSGLTGWRFESSSAHRKALQKQSFRVRAATPWPPRWAVATLVATSVGRPLRSAAAPAFSCVLGQPGSPSSDPTQSAGLLEKRRSVDLRSCSSPRAGVSYASVETTASQAIANRAAVRGNAARLVRAPMLWLRNAGRSRRKCTGTCRPPAHSISVWSRKFASASRRTACGSHGRGTAAARRS